MAPSPEPHRTASRAHIARELQTRFGLTIRQSEVVELMLDGLKERAVAHKLKISRFSVHEHMRRVYLQLGVHDHLGLWKRVYGQGD